MDFRTDQNEFRATAGIGLLDSGIRGPPGRRVRANLQRRSNFALNREALALHREAE